MSVTRSEQTRYPRWVLAVAVLTAGAIAAVAFPFKTLWLQQSALSQAHSQIAQIKRQSAALSQQAKAISTETAAVAMAREVYQLVQPGQRLIQVLPGNGSGYVAQNSTDPGSQPLVNIGEGMVPSASASSSTPTSTNTGVSGFVSRFVHTLEFWH